ncbi:MAG: thioredoxin [Gemmataceae bacterium]|nr:thioredoxin [Gemmataceae bacterium]
MASQNVITLTSENWQSEVTQSPVPVLVDFWAAWCGPCRALGPTIEKLADQFAGKAKIGKLNTDDHQDIAIRYGISSIPAILIFKGGEEPVDRTVGVRPEAEFVRMLNRQLEQ